MPVQQSEGETFRKSYMGGQKGGGVFGNSGGVGLARLLKHTHQSTRRRHSPDHICPK